MTVKEDESVATVNGALVERLLMNMALALPKVRIRYDWEARKLFFYDVLDAVTFTRSANAMFLGLPFEIEMRDVRNCVVTWKREHAEQAGLALAQQLRGEMPKIDDEEHREG